MSDIVAFHKIVPRFYSAKEKGQKKCRPFARAFGFPIVRASPAAGKKLVPLMRDSNSLALFPRRGPSDRHGQNGRGNGTDCVRGRAD
jgi:hypothetical protein